MHRRSSRRIVFLSIAGAVALGLLWAWPSIRARNASTLVQRLEPASTPPSPPASPEPVAAPAEPSAQAQQEARPDAEHVPPRSALDEGSEGPSLRADTEYTGASANEEPRALAGRRSRLHRPTARPPSTASGGRTPAARADGAGAPGAAPSETPCPLAHSALTMQRRCLQSRRPPPTAPA